MSRDWGRLLVRAFTEFDAIKADLSRYMRSDLALGVEQGRFTEPDDEFTIDCLLALLRTGISARLEGAGPEAGGRRRRVPVADAGRVAKGGAAHPPGERDEDGAAEIGLPGRRAPGMREICRVAWDRWQGDSRLTAYPRRLVSVVQHAPGHLPGRRFASQRRRDRFLQATEPLRVRLPALALRGVRPRCTYRQAPPSR